MSRFALKNLRLKTRYPCSQIKPSWLLLVVLVVLVIVAATSSFAYVRIIFSEPVSLDRIPETSSGVILVADIFNMDLDAQILSVRWSIMGACGSSFTINKTDGCSRNSLGVPINLYLNENATTTWNATIPALQYNPSVIINPLPAQYISRRNLIPASVSEVDISIDPFLPYTVFKKQSTLYYPFDMIHSDVSLLAINPSTNATVPIVTVIGYGSIVNWIGLADFGQAPPLPDSNVPQFFATLTTYRQSPVIGVVLLIFVTNWLLSLAIVYMTVLVTLGRKVNTQLILASTTVLFSIPQIRSSMPEAPPFGAFIDIGGYFINLGLVSVCTSILLFCSLTPYEKRPPAPPELPEHNFAGSENDGLSDIENDPRDEASGILRRRKESSG
ncbi:hypothetical protein BD410DRAFT_788335 [Rickenella mellea]|uniref:DUF4436 domain-containing protein n=1 Tax=Rickenella mellea TaxID=50990 RepID=A0A4Y7Q4D7_9AGAM|nr:hypothetical protein BD410DRAFT_788335 [Rickenella mellea]